MKRVLPWLAIVVVLAGTACLLRSQGRLWWCSCDYLLIWSGDPWSSDNSQHLLDPYSFTHPQYHPTGSARDATSEYATYALLAAPGSLPTAEAAAWIYSWGPKRRRH